MKTLLFILIISLFFCFRLSPQRNPGTDRKIGSDRVDRLNDGNPVRNPTNEREPIQTPYRVKDTPVNNYTPPEDYIPEPNEAYDPYICIDYIPIYCPIDNPQVPDFPDTEPVLDDLSTEEVLQLAILHLDSDEFNESIKCFNYLLKNDPLDYTIYTLRGRAYHGLELFTKAKKDFQKAIKIEKNYADAYYYLGLTEIELDNIDESKVDFGIAADLGNEKAIGIMKKYFYK